MDINDLKNNGYHVSVRHARYFPGFPSPMSRREIEGRRLSWHNIEARGGETEVEIFRGPNKVASGYARCSAKDNFDKGAGRRLALQRALVSILKEVE